MPFDWKQQFPKILLAVYGLLWIWQSISPLYRNAWWLENIVVFLLFILLIGTYKIFRLSNVSYTLIFLFLVLHLFGSHYTYAEVPFGFWLQQVFGFSRNHYDRIVHFSYGFLLAYPVREVFLRIATVKGFWGYWFPFELTMAFSGLYEIIEWVTVLVISPEAGIAYLGAQGDIWDAQKDMAMAGIGAMLSMGLVAYINWSKDKYFKKKIVNSLAVKDAAPLTELHETVQLPK